MANVHVIITREDVVTIISTLKMDLNMIFKRFVKFIFQVQKIS